MSFGDSRIFPFPDCHSHSGTMSHHPSVPPSITSSHRAQSWLSCPSMQCPGSPHKPPDMQSQTGRNVFRCVFQAVRTVVYETFSAALSSLHSSSERQSALSFSSLCLSFILVLWILLLLPAPASGFTSTPSRPLPSSTQRVPLPFHPHPTALRTRYQGNGGVGFSLAEVHQELQMLQRQLGDSERALV